MKKMELAGSQMTTNQDENTGTKVLYGNAKKDTSQLIDAEIWQRRINTPQSTFSTIIDCDSIQACNDNALRYGGCGRTATNIIEV